MVIIVVFIVILRRLCVFPLYYTHTFCFISFLLVVFVVGTATAIQPHTAHSVSMLLLFSMYTYKLNLLFSIILYQTFVPRIRHISCFFLSQLLYSVSLCELSESSSFLFSSFLLLLSSHLPFVSQRVHFRLYPFFRLYFGTLYVSVCFCTCDDDVFVFRRAFIL